MGQTCSNTCRHVVEPETMELSRTDSLDPVMYDLMRKSIEATSHTPVTMRRHINHNQQQQHQQAQQQQTQQQQHSMIQYLPTDTTTSGTTTGTSSAIGHKFGRRIPHGQHHLLYRNSRPDLAGMIFPSSHKPAKTSDPNTWLPSDEPIYCPTRLLVRQHSLRMMEEGGGTHIYAIRYPEDTPERLIAEHATERPESARQEQYPTTKAPRSSPSSSAPSSSTTTTTTTTYHRHNKVVIGKSNPTGKATAISGSIKGPSPHSKKNSNSNNKNNQDDDDSNMASTSPSLEASEIFSAAAMASTPKQKVMDWVTVSEEHKVYVADVGLTAAQCDYLVNVTEQVCRGQYAAYTYAKQTLGCREYPTLAKTSFAPVHTITTDILQRLVHKKDHPTRKLQLDDREPHIVKYDVTKKERQKLDMHTDKSEWTFLIALSNGCGVDYEGGGTYFECLDATVHIQRGHALIFPGKLRHCGQKITSGLRFLLVGFLVDKSGNTTTTTATTTNNSNNNNVASNTNAATSTNATTNSSTSGNHHSKGLSAISITSTQTVTVKT